MDGAFHGREALAEVEDDHADRLARLRVGDERLWSPLRAAPRPAPTTAPPTSAARGSRNRAAGGGPAAAGSPRARTAASKAACASAAVGSTSERRSGSPPPPVPPRLPTDEETSSKTPPSIPLATRGTVPFSRRKRRLAAQRFLRAAKIGTVPNAPVCPVSPPVRSETLPRSASTESPSTRGGSRSRRPRPTGAPRPDGPGNRW